MNNVINFLANAYRLLNIGFRDLFYLLRIWPEKIGKSNLTVSIWHCRSTNHEMVDSKSII